MEISFHTGNVGSCPRASHPYQIGPSSKKLSSKQNKYRNARKSPLKLLHICRNYLFGKKLTFFLFFTKIFKIVLMSFELETLG
jgi:hypothetical protein